MNTILSDDFNPTISPDQPDVKPDLQPDSGQPTEPRRYAWFAVASLLACIAAWIVATIDGFATVAVCVAAIVLGAISLRSRRHIVRNTAITSIIAASILLVVIVAFIITLDKLLG